jgi:mono/diheme cytochrome c family protein
VLAAGIATAGCGTKGVDVPSDEPVDHAGAVLFAERCSGCHTLSAAGTQGSGTRAVRAQGPNLDQRTETYEDALYAIQNGGFSGSIMPQNIVVGDDAVAVAQFVAKYAGSEKTDTPAPSTGAASGGGP